MWRKVIIIYFTYDQSSGAYHTEGSEIYDHEFLQGHVIEHTWLNKGKSLQEKLDIIHH